MFTVLFIFACIYLNYQMKNYPLSCFTRQSVDIFPLKKCRSRIGGLQEIYLHSDCLPAKEKAKPVELR
ncbi:hypothetical protein HanRHA438_Chr15g0700331 [Helianthus annuus]|nr:hypothetical protein HanIR_Chr15g0747651 [Helianthus annuus]KAJ0844250.1 hypothetical protein HanRHA438_Chr15g0700331 [Helianthus annuus]